MNNNNQDKSQLFATGNTFSLIVRFSIPTIIGMLVNALYVVVDRIFVGNIPGRAGDLGITAVTVSTPVTVIIFSIAMLAGAGGGANISLSLGRGEKEKAERTIANGLVLGVSLSLVIAVLSILFSRPILEAFGASPEVMPYAMSYLNISLAGSVFNTAGFCLNRYMLAQGFSVLSMRTNIIGVILNTILTPIFVFVFGMGIAGAALGTILAQFASFSWVLYCFISHKVPLKIRKQNLKLHRETVVDILKLGLSPCALQLAISLVQFFINNQLKVYGGDPALAAMGVVTAVSQMLMMPVYGINQGVQPIIGFNYGARLFNRVKKLLLQAILLATGVVSLSWIFVMILTQPIVSLFGTQNVTLMNEAPIAIRLFLMALPLVGFQVVSATYFMSVGKPRQALILNLSRQVLILIPAVLILPLFFRLHGVYVAGAVADFISTLMTAGFLLFEIRHLNRIHLETQLGGQPLNQA